MKKRFNNILLVNVPVSRGRYTVPDFPPVGLGYLSEALTVNGIEHDVLDMMLGYNENHLSSAIRNKKYDLVGFSLFTYHYKASYAIIAAIKKKFPSLKIIAGGPHVSTFREDVLKECPAIDYGVVMEGEEAIVRICDASIECRGIPGLIYRDNGEIMSNAVSVLRELDAIHYPRYRKFELKKYSSNISIITSRGCPYQCIYCPVPRTIGEIFRCRSPRNIAEEIRYWYGIGYRRILVLDDNFTLIPKRVRELCDLLKSLKLEGLVLSCANGIRADKTDYGLLKEMRDAGFNEIAFGVESASNKVLSAIRKSEKIETIEQRIKDACALDYKVVLFFIIGSPTETYDDFLESVSLALRYPVYSTRFYNLIPFPYSQLFEWVKSNNLFVSLPEKYLSEASHHINEPLFSTPEFNLEKRKKAFAYAQEVEKTVKRRYVFNKTNGPKLFRYVVSFLYANDMINHLYHSNPVIRRIGLKLRRLI
ncbi:MAG: hypothetical protein A2219_03415 [Elusimicrobia bacterium RIFOXYA2_FULL_50_26]|nr:MAG: hypothetical protein A2219_03415 [Elusimicrobia bacterium RIFOXYA2_FULL_50_26]OGS25345.1 MAG: hypothetical protein A2314_06405 [Elusimicrobia bacterium RIFOXYB2_FULL_50_12]